MHHNQQTQQLDQHRDAHHDLALSRLWWARVFAQLVVLPHNRDVRVQYAVYQYAVHLLVVHESRML